MIKQWTLTLIFFLNFFTLTAKGEEVIRSLTHVNGDQEFTILRGEDGMWFVENYILPKGSLQERVWSKTYATREEAQAEFSVKTLGFDSGLQFKTQEDLIWTETDDEVIWQTTQSWNEDWEKRYSEWVQTQVNPGFLARYDIETDCADVAYSLRWIFARIHGLPAGNRLAGSNVMFTNESMRRAWQGLSTAAEWYNDQRFRAALEYITLNTYTHTLNRDSYPVGINSEFSAGGWHLWLYSRETGHTYFIHRVNLTFGQIPLKVMSSTVPRRVRNLLEEGYWVSNQPEDGRGGVLRMRWPVKVNSRWTLAALSDMPNYSREQYSWEFMQGYYQFYDAVKTRLAGVSDPRMDLEMHINDLVAKLEARIPIVRQGYEVCQVEDCSPGSTNWESWSTPSRDSKILSTIDQIEKLITDHPEYPELASKWQNKQKYQDFEISGQKIWLENVVKGFQQSLMSYDPRDSIIRRWGDLIH